MGNLLRAMVRQLARSPYRGCPDARPPFAHHRALAMHRAAQHGRSILARTTAATEFWVARGRALCLNSPRWMKQGCRPDGPGG